MTVRDAFGKRLGVPPSLTVATNDSIACLVIVSTSAMISIKASIFGKRP